MRQRGFGLLEMVIAIGVLSALFLSGIFLAKESLSVRKLRETRESLDLLARSFYAYGSIPTDEAQFVQFLNTILKTDLDPFSRGYRLILASSIRNNAVSSVCSAENTNLAVRTPDGRVLANVVAVFLSAGEDGTYDTFTQNGLPNQSVVRVETTDVQGPLALQLTDVYSVVTLPEFKVKNCALPSVEGLSYYASFFVGETRPSNPVEGDLFYHTRNKALEKYLNGTWVGIDWQAIVKASPDYRAGRLRIINGQLQISPDGRRWFDVIPAVGANTIELMDANNYIYWIPPGTTAIIRNSNRLPIAYTPAVEPSFSVSYWNNMDMRTCYGWDLQLESCAPNNFGYYGYYLGLRPSGFEIREGLGSRFRPGIYGVPYFPTYIGGLPVVPIFVEAGMGENWGSFTLNIRSNQKWLVTGTSRDRNVGFYALYPNFHFAGVSVGTGTARSESYWLGTWWSDFYSDDNYNILIGLRRSITMRYVAITRLS